MDVCFFVNVVCCQAEVSVTGRSLVQRSPSKYRCVLSVGTLILSMCNCTARWRQSDRKKKKTLKRREQIYSFAWHILNWTHILKKIITLCAYFLLPKKGGGCSFNNTSEKYHVQNVTKNEQVDNFRSFCRNPTFEPLIEPRRLFISKLDWKLRKKLVKCSNWSTAVCGAESWTVRRVYQEYLESFETWCWRRMEKISCIDRVRDEEVLNRVKEEKNILYTVTRGKANCIGHIFRRELSSKTRYWGKDRGTCESDGKTRKKT
jgi:hypothetical protein